jgi:hypothetical protein
VTRILVPLATISLILVLAALLLGLSIGDLYGQPGPATLAWATVHRLLGVAAALAVVFVESVIVTYFIGTSRWCKEVVETYQLPAELARESNRLKRRTFPWVVAGMLTVVGIGALGAAGDPATGRPDTAPWAVVHLIVATCGTLLIAWTYVAAWNNIAANHAVIERIVREVARIRKQRGLDDAAVNPASAEAS